MYAADNFRSALNTSLRGEKMGYILLILFFLMWRNVVYIRKAVNYCAYGTTANPQSILRKMFLKLADIRSEEVQKKKETKQTKKHIQEVNEVS